ncbi:MAG: hypothetical protein UU65_C0001G0265 [candidate division CPR2 bacterium GW2011_GWC1_41_48]|uniref:Uncharacterized protein n=1 Tax=candidate division CPR2 bacterium GW2011_GWC1_41_48 TaxID=1618344 RepID=A0A0G0WA54_UNCC2|nr:MAG: hypothetical protein UT47_C0001G0265 [candidate division CPR2 bacterium GW2011_GWC2_39_35]KKS09860.1 MAG: hypothetical protein UU65_C0001G0265 [candidate division CPR2 bacterium GW2011_GWC1_41_48]
MTWKLKKSKIRHMQKEKSKRQDAWKKKYPTGKSELAWNVEDYEFWGCDVPDRMLNNPSKTEGKMMTEREVEEWVSENFRAFSVIKEENLELFHALYKDFVQDLEYLVSLGKLDEEAFEELRNTDFFDF